jgi:hypothetical protein
MMHKSMVRWGGLVVSGITCALPRSLPAQELAATVAPAKQYCQGLEAAIHLRREIRDSIHRLVDSTHSGESSSARRRLRTSMEEAAAAATELEKKLTAYTRDHPRTADTVANIMKRLDQDSMVVSVFGNGNVKSAIADTSGATRVQGAIGVVRSTCRADFTVQLNVAASGDTLFRDYGTSLLAPATGGFFKAGLVDFRAVDAMRLGGLGHVGVHAYGTVSTNNWGVVGASDTTIFQATVVGLGLGVYKQLLRNDLDRTFVNVGLDLGAAYRGLYGDLAAEPNDENRVIALQSKAKHFIGPEIGFSLQVSQVRGALHFYYFPSTDIPGLGRGQVVAGFAIQGGIISRRVLRDRS